jgi:uncharacterized membrane protein HdeD (DUF308 family)
MAAWGISEMAGFTARQIFALKISGILATVNIVIAFSIIYFFREKDQSQFARYFLVGLVVRLLGMLSVIFMILKYSTLDHFIFIGSLFVLYFVYQIWEVLILNSNHK